MAHTQSAYFRRSQEDRGLAPAQVAAFSIAAFLIGVAMAGSGASVGMTWAASFGSGAAFLVFKKGWLAAGLVLSACFLGSFYYHFYFLARDARISVPLDMPVSFSGVVAAEPGHSAKSEYFPLRLEPPLQGRIRVVVPPGSGFRYGDAVKLQGRIRAPEKERDLPVSIFPKTDLTDRGRGDPVRQALSGLKHKMLAVFPHYLPSTEAAFLGGITLGARANFSPEFADALAASGTTHLVALSGYNIAILVFVIFGSCLLVVGRRIAFCVTTLAILAFVAMVGAEPSVVRAAAMGFMALLARELGRPYGLPHAFLWTAFLMVIFDPSSLFMPGFQLSFMSLLGIVYLSPLILKRLGTSRGDDAGLSGGFRESAALTVSAQLAVAPIALHNFGGISLASFLTNALILPFMPLTMFFGFLLIACGSIFPSLGSLAGLIAHIFLAYEIMVIKVFAVLSLPVKATLPALAVFVYYLALAVLIRRYRLRGNE